MEPEIGVWHITPSNEFRSAGPMKQLLTSHVFTSAHSGGEDLIMKFAPNESWKKVYGPVFVYLNSLPDGGEPFSLWNEAKEQFTAETKSCPHKFPNSTDYVQPEKRGSVACRLLVHDKYVSNKPLVVTGAYVGLAWPGDVGSWQRESKGYQFWTTTDKDSYFVINALIPGEYNLYAWVPSYIGDHNFKQQAWQHVYESPRNGPTLWAIGIADRTAEEFYGPDPNPDYINPLYLNHTDRFRQYGMWELYSELYPAEDLVTRRIVFSSKSPGRRITTPTKEQRGRSSSKWTLSIEPMRINDPKAEPPFSPPESSGRTIQ